MKAVYTVDPNHTTVGFSAKHMMVTTQRGRFAEWSGQLEADEDNPAGAVVTGTIVAASIESGHKMRDRDLRSKVLDSDHHPTITYRSTRIEPAGDRKYRVIGDLTIAGHAHPITLEVETEDGFQDHEGFRRIGFSAHGKLRRADWGLTWNMVLDQGRLLVSEHVSIEIDGAFVRKVE